MFLVHLGIFLFASSFILPIDTAPIAQDKGQSDILYFENDNDGTGNYKFSFQTVDNTRREEIGQVVYAGQPDQYIRVDGSYSYIRPDGVEETVYYTADKDGYRIVPAPEQSHSTVLAGVPPSVLASLAG